ncbi:MAG: Lrp/AsnC family transcriptional regulator [Anaerolineae bacterium]|nr:Lrp/AsnC family transcriptional regulator [Anaerolineae bacterium]
MYKLDKLDKQILNILQEDGRASHVNIARQLGVGHTRVRDRVLRLEQAGVIKGYRVVIDPAVLGQGVFCIVQLKVDQQFDFDELVKDILEIEEVVDVANVTGEVDAHIRVWARDVAHLREILYNKLSVLPAHKNTNSTIVLKHWRKPLGLGA